MDDVPRPLVDLRPPREQDILKLKNDTVFEFRVAILLPGFSYNQRRVHIGAKWYAKGDFIQEWSKQVHTSLAYGYEVSDGLGGHSESPEAIQRVPKLFRGY